MSVEASARVGTGGCAKIAELDLYVDSVSVHTVMCGDVFISRRDPSRASSLLGHPMCTALPSTKPRGASVWPPQNPWRRTRKSYDLARCESVTVRRVDERGEEGTGAH